MSGRKNLVDMVQAAAKRGAETTPKITKERAAFRQKVAAKVKEAADLASDVRRAPDAGKSRQRALISDEFRQAGTLAIEKMLPSYLRSILELDTDEPYIVGTAQLEQWLKKAKKRCERSDKELSFKGQSVPRCATNTKNLTFFLNLRTNSTYGSLPPGVKAKPNVGGYAKTPDTPAKAPIKGYGVLPAGDGSYEKVPPNPYGAIEPRYQKIKKPSDSPNYGDIPSKAKALQEQVAATKSATERRERVVAMAARAGIVVKSETAELDVARINVERGRILLDTLEQVENVVKSTRNATRVVDAATMRARLGQPYALVATRAIRVGDPIAHYDGELVSSESARHLEMDGVGETLRTLRAGLWAVRGYTDPEEVPRAGGLGSFAADNLDLCASARLGREQRLANTTLNAHLVTVTHTLNALGNESDYRPEESALVLVADTNIAAGDAIFYRHVSLAQYLGGADDRS